MKNQLTEEVKDALHKSTEVLRAGGLVLFPSSVGWVLGCDAVNLEANAKLQNCVGTFADKQISALIDNATKLNAYVDEVPDMAWDLFELSEKPLTISFSNYKNLASNLMSYTMFLGIQVASESFANYLCFRFRNPIAICLAGNGGSVFEFSKVPQSVLSQADYVVQSSQSIILNNVSSSVIKLSDGNLIEIIKK